MYKTFKHQFPIQIRFSDLDPLNHVNNANYLTYIEQARVSYFKEMSGADMGLTKEGVILAKATIDFRQPIRLSDEIIVFTRCTRIGGKSFVLEYELVKVTPQGYVTVALASTILVSIDYTVNKSIPVPHAWRQKLLEFEGKENIVTS